MRFLLVFSFLLSLISADLYGFHVQNYTFPDKIIGPVTSLFSYADQIYLTFPSQDNNTLFVALSSVTFELIQDETLEIMCSIPQYSWTIEDEEDEEQYLNSFNLLCGGKYVSAFYIQPSKNGFDIQANSVFPEWIGWSWLNNPWMPVITQIDSGTGYVVFSSSSLVGNFWYTDFLYGIGNWTNSVWTSIATGATYANAFSPIIATGSINGSDVLVTTYYLYTQSTITYGTYANATLFPAINGTSGNIGYTFTSDEDTGKAIFDCWSFTGYEPSKPILLKSLTISNNAFIATTPGYDFFIADHIENGIQVTQYKWSWTEMSQISSVNITIEALNVFADSKYFYISTQTELLRYVYST